MTAINIALGRSQAFIATDSLVSGGQPPDLFVSKAWSLPHLRAVTAGCGQQHLVIAWMTVLLRGLPEASDIEDVDKVAPEFLRRAWDGTGGRSSTIYLVGVNRSDEVVGFAYNSGRDFASERLAPGMYAHPCPEELRAPQAPVEVPDLPTSEPAAPAAPVHVPWTEKVQRCVSIMARQRELFPESIGGQILCLHLSPDGIQQHWREFE